MTFTRFIQLLMARRRLLIGFVGLALALALVANWFLPDSYVAEVALVIDSRSPDPVTGDPRSALGSAAFIATQVDVIASENVASKVVEMLRLHERPIFRDALGDSSETVKKFQISRQLLRSLDVRPSLDSNVVEVSYSAPDPLLAAEIANAFSKAYIQTSLDLTIDPARRRVAWFDEQLELLRTRLHSAQTALAGYQNQSRIVATAQPLDIEKSRLEELSTQMIAAKADMYEAQTRHKQMLRAIASSRSAEMPDLVGNDLLRTLKSDLGRAESKLANAAENYGPNHPQYQIVNAEVGALRSRMDKEVQNIIGSLEQAATMAEQRSAQIQTALKAQEEHILELRTQLDRSSLLSRDVESAQKAYDDALQRASAARLESQVDQTSIAILNPAAVPTSPAGPKRSLNVFLALVIGSLLAVAMVLAVEIAAPRVRDAADLVASSGLAVLSEIPAARGIEARSTVSQLWPAISR